MNRRASLLDGEKKKQVETKSRNEPTSHNGPASFWGDAYM